jgi:hypothetical protein
MSGEHSLDELARGLASGSVTRRKALRLMGGILAATVMGSVPGIEKVCRNRSCQ